METYPSSFPCPLIEGYAIQIDAGLLRTNFQSGNTRQRRAYSNLPHYITMSFAIKINLFDEWLQWINDNAFEWCLFPAVTWANGTLDEIPKDHVLRLIADIEISAITNEYFRVTVRAETNTAAGENLPPQARGNWVVGGTPSEPSSPDVTRPGGTTDPKTDYVDPGTTENPSALV